MQNHSTTIFTFTIKLFLLVLFIGTQPTFAQHSLGLDKKGKTKRIHFYAGTNITVKMIDKERVSGRIDAIYDSSFVIEGRKIMMNEIDVVFSTRPVLRFIGGALMVSGAFYFTLDAVNNLLNYEARGYVFSNSVWAPSAIAVGSGAILYYFSTRRTKVYEKQNFRIFNTTPIPIAFDSSAIINKVCDNGAKATLKQLNLDGCNWVIDLPNGDRLEPVNILEFIDADVLSASAESEIKIEYHLVKSASICMAGQPIVLTCLEVLGKK